MRWFLKRAKPSVDGEGRPRGRVRLPWSSAYTPRGYGLNSGTARGLQEDAIEREVDFWTADPDEDQRAEER